MVGFVENNKGIHTKKVCISICMDMDIYIFTKKRHGGLEMMQTITLMEATIFLQY